MKGISAVIATILMLMITIALAGLAYMYISGVFTQRTGVVIEIDETATSCVATTNAMTIYVRNTGTIATNTAQLTISGTNSQGAALVGGACGNDALNAGSGAIPCDLAVTGTDGTNTIVISGPTNTVRGTVYCA